jgi:acyl-CoA synthetase (AMP-forming)/AMP-acid ligase II
MSLEMMSHPDREQIRPLSLTDIAAGGAPRPVAHVQRLKDSFDTAQPALGYGLTETNAVGCGNYLGQLHRQAASTGRACPMSTWPSSAPATPTADGERGRGGDPLGRQHQGLLEEPGSDRRAFTADGYLKTGDIGFLDEDGYLFIVDRKKDIIIRGGENISSAEVEAAVYACEAVAEAAVFGRPDERLGEVRSR